MFHTRPESVTHTIKKHVFVCSLPESIPYIGVLSGVHTINTPAMKPANTLAMIARELLVAFTRHKQAHVKHQIGHGSDCNEEI